MWWIFLYISLYVFCGAVIFHVTVKLYDIDDPWGSPGPLLSGMFWPFVAMVYLGGLFFKFIENEFFDDNDKDDKKDKHK